MLKHYKSTLVGIFLIFSVNLRVGAQEDTSGFQSFKATRFPVKANSIRIGAVPLLVGEIPYCGEVRITYERPVSHNQSLLAGFSYNFPDLYLLLASVQSGSGISELSWRGARVMLGYRWYPLKKNDAPKGFYFGPFFSYNFLKIRDKHDFSEYEIINYLNVSLVVGEQLIAHNGFTFDIFGGLGYKDNFISYDNSIGAPIPTLSRILLNRDPGPGAQHIKITLQLNLGYSF